MLDAATQPGAEPYATVGAARLWRGDAREPLPLPDRSVHCVVTSPPYWGLRDYGTATWEGGDPACPHAAPAWVDDPGDLPRIGGDAVRSANAAKHVRRSGGVCRDCGARRVDRQLGSEATPEEYVANLVQVFREVWRVLRDDGVLWLNLGDSYTTGASTAPRRSDPKSSGDVSRGLPRRGTPEGLKPKDLVGIPWMVAFALRADGWYLRSDCIWAKPNPMPESVTDRPTKAHEYVFLLTKSERYFYDAEAVREPDHRRNVLHKPEPSRGLLPPHRGIRKAEGRNGAGRNLRSVWPIATRPYSGAHFAVFPPELARICILAGTSARGCCPACGAPWRRAVEAEFRPQADVSAEKGVRGARTQKRMDQSNRWEGYPRGTTQRRTVGWEEPTCPCASGDPVPCTVLDPFTGSGTTGAESVLLGRAFVGRDLNRAYLDELAIPRLRDAVGHLFADAPAPDFPPATAPAPADPSLFGEVAP
jgi:DNA modification methylase